MIPGRSVSEGKARDKKRGRSRFYKKEDTPLQHDMLWAMQITQGIDNLIGMVTDD